MTRHSRIINRLDKLVEKGVVEGYTKAGSIIGDPGVAWIVQPRDHSVLYLSTAEVETFIIGAYAGAQIPGLARLRGNS